MEGLTGLSFDPLIKTRTYDDASANEGKFPPSVQVTANVAVVAPAFIVSPAFGVENLTSARTSGRHVARTKEKIERRMIADCVCSSKGVIGRKVVHNWQLRGCDRDGLSSLLGRNRLVMSMSYIASERPRGAQGHS